MLEDIPLQKHPDIIVGFETSDDAGVVRLENGKLLIQTLDFFTPIVDDPYIFGAISATNALSDIYAMGGKPLWVMNICCFSLGKLEIQVFKSIIKGGYDKVREAGAFLLGGHTVEDVEIKYGLSVIGEVEEKNLMTNQNAKIGDTLILTKPIGTGILSTALKAEQIMEDDLDEATKWMLTLNDKTSEAAVNSGIKACTDITGFGLAGHALEMAKASGVQMEFELKSIPVIGKTIEYIRSGFCPGGLYCNRRFTQHYIEVSKNTNEELITLIFDPQTSGGLLLSCPQENLSTLEENFKNQSLPYWKIGRVIDGTPGTIKIID